MELVIRAIGPLQTNVCLVGDPRTREAIVIDGAIPGLPWVVDELTRRDHAWSAAFSPVWSQWPWVETIRSNRQSRRVSSSTTQGRPGIAPSMTIASRVRGSPTRQTFVCSGPMASRWAQRGVRDRQVRPRALP
jgi:hypothetical protein